MISSRTLPGSHARRSPRRWHDLTPLRQLEDHLELLEVCSLVPEGTNSSISDGYGLRYVLTSAVAICTFRVQNCTCCCEKRTDHPFFAKGISTHLTALHCTTRNSQTSSSTFSTLCSPRRLRTPPRPFWALRLQSISAQSITPQYSLSSVCPFRQQHLYTEAWTPGHSLRTLSHKKLL